MQGQVYVTGSGLVCGLGSGVTTVYQRMLAGERGLRPITRFPVDAYPQGEGGQVPEATEADLEARYPDDDPALRFIRAAAEEALGGAVADPADPELGLVLATNFGLMETLEWCWRERIETGELDAETFSAQQDVVARVAALVGAGGPRAQLSLSCASGAAAVDLARRWLLAGRVRRVLTVSYDALTEYCWSGLTNLRTISTDTVRPFDTERAGTVFSEGAAAMLLSREATGADELAVLGTATNNNAFHLTAPTKAGEGSRRVMAAALVAAGCDGGGIDLVCAHATGTTANDSTESAAINNLAPDRAGAIPVAAFKSQLGHMLGAAGMAEAVITLAALRAGRVPAIVSLREPDPECAVDMIRERPRDGRFRTAVTNSAGIGGNNAATVLGQRHPSAPAAVTLRPVGLLAAGWVLPGTIGHGTGLPVLDPAALIAAAPELADFKAKAYLQSVKGYLDPAGAYTLAAAALCRQQLGEDVAWDADTAVVAATHFGAPTSGMTFYRQFLEKGARLASPMIFPHGYSNTAANLVAIEFGVAGPHYVFDRAESAGEAIWLAQHLIATGDAETVLLILSEAAPTEALPDGQAVLPGAICLTLGVAPDAATAWTPPRTEADPAGLLSGWFA